MSENSTDVILTKLEYMQRDITLIRKDQIKFATKEYVDKEIQNMDEKINPYISVMNKVNMVFVMAVVGALIALVVRNPL